MAVKKIKVDFRKLKSITNAERQKSKLENKGYSLIEAKRVASDKYVFTYSKLGKVI